MLSLAEGHPSDRLPGGLRLRLSRRMREGAHVGFNYPRTVPQYVLSTISCNVNLTEDHREIPPEDTESSYRGTARRLSTTTPSIPLYFYSAKELSGTIVPVFRYHFPVPLPHGMAVWGTTQWAHPETRSVSPTFGTL